MEATKEWEAEFEQKIEDNYNFEPIGFKLAELEQFASDDLTAQLKRKLDLLGTRYFEQVFMKTKLSRVKNDLREKFESKPEQRVSIYDPYIEEYKKMNDKIDESIRELIDFRAKTTKYIIDTDVPDVTRRYSETFNGLLGDEIFGMDEYDHNVDNRVLVGARKMWFRGFSKKDGSGKHQPWLRGRLSYEDINEDNKCKIGINCFYGNYPLDVSNEATRKYKDWTLVRHVPEGESWYSYSDALKGEIKDELYAYEEDEEWTINFEEAVPGYNQFLFSTGDKTRWLVASKDTVMAEYQPESRDRHILASSEVPYYDYYVGWFSKETNEHSPFVSLHTPVDV